MIEGFAYLGRSMPKEDYEKLLELAKADKHGVFVPTHPIYKKGELVGYFSIGQQYAPIVFAWLSTKDLKARESLSLVNMVENHVYLNGAQHICFPIPKESPFYELMESLGYKSAGDYTFFVKQL